MTNLTIVPKHSSLEKNPIQNLLNNHTLNFDEHILDSKVPKNRAANLIQMFMAYLELHNSKKKFPCIV